MGLISVASVKHCNDRCSWRCRVCRFAESLTPDTMTSLEPLATDYLLGFDAWDALRIAGARSIWDHIDETERGVHGRFAQRIIAAWHAADSGNQRALYEAFPHIFNAR